MAMSAAYPSPGVMKTAFAAILFPLRHPDSENFERENVTCWLNDHIAAGVKFITLNGLYDWGWLWADLGVAMPPSEQLEEIGALATIVDENRYSYSLDALCAWRGLPGKDTALLEEAVRPAASRSTRRTRYNRTFGNYQRTLSDRTPRPTRRTHSRYSRASTPSSTRRARAPPIGLTSACCRWCTKCAAAASVLTKAPPNRLSITACKNASARSLSYRSSSAAHVSMAEIASKKWKVRTFDAQHIDYQRTEKGDPSFKGGKLGWMATDSHWLPQLIATASKYEPRRQHIPRRPYSGAPNRRSHLR